MTTHPTPRFVITLLVLVANVGLTASAQAPEKIDPRGRPARFKVGSHRMYGIWYENGTWKLRTTSARGVRIEYLGTVEIDKDKITSDYTALDREKNRRDSDLVKMERNRRKMSFRFVTIGAVDGIDFKVGEKAQTVTFHLRIADDDNPELIFIGEKSAHPKSAKFILPAHPDAIE